MALAQIVEKILQSDRDEVFLLPHLDYWLVPLLNIFSRYQARILVLVATRDQVNILDKEFPSSFHVMLDEDFLRQPGQDYYDYLFFIGECFPNNWRQYTQHLIIGSQHHVDEVTFLKEPTLRKPDIRYDARNYTLDQRDDLHKSIARQAAQIAYTSPDSKILLLVATSTSVDALIGILRRAQLPIPVNSLDHASSGPGIIVAQREAGLLMASRINPTYTFDALIKQRWMPTWTQGRRFDETFVSKEEGDQDLTLSGVVHRMMTRDLYNSLEMRKTSKVCLWRNWLIQNSDKTSPLTIDRCWEHLTSEQQLIEKSTRNSAHVDPQLKDFLLRQPLGLRPALVLWKWAQDELPLFPMISLIAMLDSYGPPYFQYPVRTSEYQDREGEYQTLIRRHSERYFGDFAGKTDLDVLLKIWLSLLDFAGGFNDVPNYVDSWALQYSIDRHKILEAYLVARNLIKYFEDNKKQVQVGPFNIDTFLVEAYDYLEAVYKDRLVKPAYSDGSIYTQGSHNFLRAGPDYTLAPNPNGPAYALVTSEEGQGRCLVWIMLPENNGLPDEVIIEVV